VRLVTEQEPGKPLFVFGYSMGGTIGLLWAIRRLAGGDGQEAGKMPALPVRGLIVVGPGIRIGPGVFPIMRRLVWLVSRVFPRLRLVRLRGGGISRDPLVVAGFQNDPLVFHGRIPVRTGAEILRAADRVTGELESVRLPLLILHGTVDRVCDCEGSRQLYLRAASTDKTLRLYDGLYHEILSEPERRQVLDDLLNWLDARRG
jgi:alpha-beta hydrolase superfamily lysophospholipase